MQLNLKNHLRPIDENHFIMIIRKRWRKQGQRDLHAILKGFRANDIL